ncbi:hypothetical protein MMC27_002564 [Xylographa pallens]|nr:hypothetical protein [Xylographa pallens]
MTPQPRRQNPQHQALTVTLKNICRDYPAGGGILRELLQNADDAGASEMAFVLDTRSHPASNLLHPGLEKYQGPALLAYNNAKFSAEDFESLSSLGASRKERDALATGKFGRGFSSVFNWTDCPSIVSDRTLFFLDPHHSWSASWDPPGGPEWDFTAHAQDDAMENQLSAYSSFLSEFDRPLDGTIIRIPLRTAVQSRESAIRDQGTTVLDVQSSMEGFGTEVHQGGLLFLKSVTKVSLYMDENHLASTEVMNKSEVVEARACIREALCNILDKNTSLSEHIAFDIHFQNRSGDFDSSASFSMHHVIEPNLPDKSLVKWAAMNKLHPWIGLAAPMMGTADVGLSGDLFTVLRLHIPTKQPVHIHGMFSISPDRGKLHGPSDASVQDQRPNKWNATLFEQLVPQAWTKLLERIVEKHPERTAFQFWPQEPPERREMWDSLCSLLVSRASHEDCPIWYTDVGYVSLRDGLLASEHDFVEQRQAFHDAQMPVIYLSETVLKHAVNNSKGRKLCQRTALECLRSSSHLLAVPNESKIVLLEYISSVLPLTEIADLAIFPFEDGVLRAINQHNVYLQRDASERELFKGTPELNLDVDKVSADLLKRLRQLAVRSSMSFLRFRNQGDLQDYCSKTVFRLKKFHKSLDMIDADEEIRSFVERVWKWITPLGLTQRALTAIGSLWLLPLTNGKYRKMQPESALLIVTYTAVKNTKNIMLKIASLEPESAPLILDSNAFPIQSLSSLSQIAGKKFNLAVRNADIFVHFLEWLVDGRHLLEQADSADKACVLDAILDWFWGCKNHDKLAVRSLRQLCVFKRVRRCELNDTASIDRSWTKITGNKVIGLKDLRLIPPSTDITYIDATDDRECGMIEKLKLVDCLSVVQIIETVIIPSLRRGDYANCPRDILEMLLCNFYHCSTDSQASIAMLPIIPLDMRGLRRSQTYAAATSLIDPAAAALRDIFFDDEVFHPEPRIYQDFAEPLKKCGLKTTLDRMIVIERLNTYTSNRYSFEQLNTRVRALLKMPLSTELGKDADFRLVIGKKRWLPTRSDDQAYQLTDPSSCRDEKDFLLVGQVMPTLPFRVGNSWRLCFHWQDPIAADSLISQLAFGIEKSDLQIVNSVLSYVANSPQRSNYLQCMKGMDVVWSSEECFIKPDMAYQFGCQNLVPYLHNVESGFGSTHSRLLANLGVRLSPKSRQLLEVQLQLEIISPLSGAALNVALEVTRLLSLDTTSTFTSLKIPSDKGILIRVTDVAFNDLGPCDLPDNIFLTHPGISREIADRLHIEPLSERVLKGDLGIPDFDEEEFDQREEVTDGIRDTLERYPKESTFHEYLANADDCGSASEVNWLLDETAYPARNLITPELAQHQGPSLLVHNDGVFREKDFEGLKHVGRGSKRDDATTIGKFGRGSQTMYHWTDVPMILSGEFLLILDPQQLNLPVNYRTGRRKAGVKIKLSKLRRGCQDQLAPFDGLWGYALDSDHYNGTIFRFPLRKVGSQSELLETSIHLLSTATTTFQDAFETARLSLIFLKNIQKINLRKLNRHIRNKSSGWEVRRANVGSATSSDWLLIQIRKASPDGAILSWTDRWWRATKDLQDVPNNLQYRHKRTMKQITCGIAALVSSESSEAGSIHRKEPAPRFFNWLPLPLQSSLPVHIHATFLLSGDRQNISVEETARDTGSNWNKWILEQAIPQLYLSFLEDVGRHTGAKVFSFFPTKGSTANILSDLVRSSFWSLLPASHHRLYPVVEKISAGDLVEMEKESHRQCRAPRLVEFQKATFDLLDASTSKDLITVLPFWFENLVRPTESLRGDMRRLPGIRSINPSLVRKALQSKEAVGHLVNSIKRENQLLKSLLRYAIPVKDADFDELNNCGILPVADGTLGTLVARSPSSQSTYFSVAVADRSLFPFAAGMLISDEINPEFTNKIKGSERFNVHNLNEGHIGKLLQMKPEWPAIPDVGFKEWLVQFWKYMNERCPAAVDSGTSDIMNTYMNIQLQKLPLHEVRCDTMSRFASFESFPGLPAVVEPASPDERTLCLGLPGLYLANPEMVPTQFLTAEQYLSKSASLCRLLRAMSLLASRQGKALRDYVRVNLHGKNLEILQQVVVKAFKQEKPLRRMFPNDSESTLNDILPFARDLPIWTSKSNDYLTALEALAAVNDSLVLPWSPKFDCFVHQSNDPVVLGRLGVPLLDDETMLKNHVLENLPAKIDSENQAPFLRLIAAMSTSSLVKRKGFVCLLRERRLAATRDGGMVKPSEVYDHSDEIFVAAFRLQATDHFLLKDVEGFHSFWREVGLRCQTNGKLLGSDYVPCLHAILKRLEGQEDEYLEADIDTVLRPLCKNDYALRDISNTHWSLLATIKVFPPLSDFESQPRFRRERMESLAGSSKALSLREIRSMNQIRVCWSQVLFTSSEPSGWVLGQVSESGCPSCAIVWEHLEYLACIAGTIEDSEVELFLLDLLESYEYLQTRLQESKESFRFAKSAVWLNVDNLRDVSSYELRHSWQRLDHLILLSTCDAPPLMAVRSFLTPFAKLLNTIGCKSMMYPTFRSATRDDSEAMASRVNRLRLKSFLTDVTFSVEGISLSAHRVVLAAKSDYCMSQFNGSWNTGDVVELEDMTPHTLENLIDYAYQDSFDWTSLQADPDDDTDIIADKLDRLLDMLVGADRWLMQDMKTDVEQQILQGNRLLIRADNVRDIRHVADEASAKVLERYCEDFEKNNAEAVRLANLSDGGEDESASGEE